MMLEDEYPGFQKLYRQLRKEGLKFPMRDPNLRMLMSNIISYSPMFDHVEEIAGRTNKSTEEETKQPRPNKKIKLPNDQKNVLSVEEEMLGKKY